MRYHNLNELIRGSRSSALYFFSLPPEMQVKLGEHGELIHTAKDLHDAVNAADIYEREVQNADYLAFYFWKKR